MGYLTVRFPTSVIGSLFDGQGLVRKKWCCASGLIGWWPVVTGLIAGDALDLVVLLSLSTPTHGHTLVTYTLTENQYS